MPSYLQAATIEVVLVLFGVVLRMDEPTCAEKELW